MDQMENNGGRLPDRSGFGKRAVYFDHGAPSVIPVFTLASEIFPHLERRLIHFAQIAGEIVWSQGLYL